MGGLLSSRLVLTQASNLSQQLDAILSTAVETSSLGVVTRCIKQWAAKEQPGSAQNLRYIMDWTWNKVVRTKEELRGICAPPFDSSSAFIDPQTMQLLQHKQTLLSNLNTIFHSLHSETCAHMQKGLVGLTKKKKECSLIYKYSQVVLWFCRRGLLPEGSDCDALQISKPLYTQSIIDSYYTARREELTKLAKGKLCADCLMIDGLVGQCGERLSDLWKSHEGGTGQYPPPTLHALLDIYLLDNIDEAAKHAVVIYLLLDVMYSIPNKEGESVECFPNAFNIPIGLVKLVQGLWLLDHSNYRMSVELLLHPAATQCQFQWQHERVLQTLMCQGQHSLALYYFRRMKPLISSTSQAKVCLSVLVHNRWLMQALYLVRQQCRRLDMRELLFESCQELGLLKELLRLPLGFSELKCLEKFLHSAGVLPNKDLLTGHCLQQGNYVPAVSLYKNLVNETEPKLEDRSSTRNSTLDGFGKVLPRAQRKQLKTAKPCQRLTAVHRKVSQLQPLSTFTNPFSGTVMSQSAFIKNILKMEMAQPINGATPQFFPVKRQLSSRAQSLLYCPFRPSIQQPLQSTKKLRI